MSASANVEESFLKPFTKASVQDLTRTGSDLKLKPTEMVWLQGDVVSVSSDRTSIKMTDDISRDNELDQYVTVTNCDIGPRGLASSIMTGSYCQVLGEIQGVYPVEVKASKIVHIKDEGLKLAWPIELQEFKRLANGELAFPTAQ